MRYSTLEVMEMAVQTEKGGRQFYEDVARSLGDDKLVNVFRFLADEEARHVRVFEQISRSVKTAADEVPYNWDEATLYLRAIVSSRYFLSPDKAEQLAAATKTPAQAIEYALGFEKDTLLFFNEVLAMMDDANRSAVGQLIEEEKSHIRKLSALRL